MTLAKQLNATQLTKRTPELGRNLTQEELQNFKDDQVCQLYDLMQETTKPIVDPVEEDLTKKLWFFLNLWNCT